MEACESLPVTGKRVLVIIPDGTRTAPIPLFFRLLYEALGSRVSRLDYLIALGTHPPMSDAAIDALVGVSARASAPRTIRRSPSSIIAGMTPTRCASPARSRATRPPRSPEGCSSTK